MSSLSEYLSIARNNKRNIDEFLLYNNSLFEKNVIHPNELLYVEHNYPSPLKSLDLGAIFIDNMSSSRLIDILKFRSKIGVIGSRIIDDNSRAIIGEIISDVDMCEHSNVFISGGALGVDSYVSSLCYSRGFNILEVLPVLRDTKLEANKPRVNSIKISPYLYRRKYSKYCYYLRNEVICALSDILIVIKASKYSGSMNCANTMIKMNKPVFVNDRFDLLNSEYSGNELLIKVGCQGIDNLQSFLKNR